MGFIYKMRNTANQKVYIGKTTKPILERFQEHIKKAKIHTNRYLYDAMNHYGYENFTIEEIEECEDDLLDDREKYWISYYSSDDKNYGYNMTAGGGGGDTWSKNDNRDLTIMKIIVKNRGKKRSNEFRKYLSEKFSGRYWNPEVSRKSIETKKNNIAKERGYSSWEQRKQYIENCKKLFMQIPKSQCVIYTPKRHKSKGKTYDEIYSPEYAKEKISMCSIRWTGNNNPNYKDVNQDILLDKILNNEKVDDIAKFFKTSTQTIFHKCNEYFGTSKTREVKKIYGTRI